MESQTHQEKAFLFQLYQLTGSDTDAKVSMYEVGQALGLDKIDSGVMAESLFIQGLAELKTLSGGIGITPQGLLELDVKVPPKDGVAHTLGQELVLSEADKTAVEELLCDIRDAVGDLGFAHERMEELIMDIKCMEFYMMGAQAKTAVIRELIRSVENNLKDGGSQELAHRASALIA